MEPLDNGQPGRHECWEELAEHALTRDQVRVYATEEAAARRAAQLGKAGICTGYTRTAGGWRLLHDPDDVRLPHRAGAGS